MTMTQELPTLARPARRRELPAVPVLIRVPMMAGVVPISRPDSRRRRRLRREVRVAAFALLFASPVFLGVFLLGSDRPGSSVIAATSRDSGDQNPPLLALPSRPGPIVTLSAPSRDRGVPVILPGYLLPADATEETSDGGY